MFSKTNGAILMQKCGKENEFLNLYDIMHKSMTLRVLNIKRHDIWGPFYLHGLALMKSWLSNYIHHKVDMKLFICSQISTVEPMKFGRG